MGGTRHLLSLLALLAWLLLLTSCYRSPSDARDAHDNGSWAYSVEAPGAGSRVVAVEATFEGARTERLAIAPESMPFVHDMKVRNGAGYRTVERRGNEWFERACTWRCTVSYKIDLGALAAACGDEVDCARRVGDATMSPALAWLVHPTPRLDAPVTVRVHSTEPFASGMNATDDTGKNFAFRSYDLDEGSFTAFGPLRRHSFDVKRGHVDVVVVGTTQYAMSDDAMTEWVDEAANITVPLFGRFPVDRATVFVVPAKNEEEVVFGKVLSLAGASVVLVVGDKMRASARHRDWVLVHELFHLGFPTFRGEGRWLGEGLATYYEPILRARAGWTTEADVFRQFARNMPRGQPPLDSKASSAGLAGRTDLDTIYWGGAMFCLAADVRIREETRGRRSLDDVLRAALAAGGDATKVWTVHDVVALGDRTTGTTVLSEMYERYAARGERIDLEGLLSSLGVGRDGRPGNAGVILADEADGTRPLAWVRRDIVETPRETIAQSR